MIDIKFLRENPDAVKENIKKKFQDHKLPLVDAENAAGGGQSQGGEEQAFKADRRSDGTGQKRRG